MHKNKSNHWFYISVIILGVYLIIRFFDQASLMWIFPLDYTNDMASYMAQLDFLVKCGYNNFCQYWYNGFVTFNLTPPAWYFFTLPIYLLSGNIQVTFFISLILIYVLGLIAMLYFGRLLNLSTIKSSAFFLLFFANAIAIGNFVRLGRVPELFAWVNFCIVVFMLLFYKDRKLNRKFFWIIIPTTIVLLAHQTVAILALVSLLSLFLIKHKKERIITIYCGLAAIVVTSFWWIPYLKRFGASAGTNIVLTETLLTFNRNYLAQTMAAFIIPLILWIAFYFYWKSSSKKRNTLIFFSIPLLLSILLFTRLIVFIPALKYIYPDVYMLYFLFFIIFMFLKTDFSRFSKKISLLAHSALTIFCIISVLINILHTPNFVKPGDFEQEALNSLNYVDGRFLLIGSTPHSLYSYAFYSYASIYPNLMTAGGWYTAIITPDYYNALKKIDKDLEEQECNSLINGAKFLNTSHLITFDHYCSTLELCGLDKKFEDTRICIYTVEGVEND